MKKLSALICAFILCFTALCGCAQLPQEKPAPPLVENPHDRLDVTQQHYRDISFLNKEQRSLLEDNAETLYRLAFYPFEIFSDMVGEDLQYFHTEDMRYVITPVDWQTFNDRMLNIITQSYFDLLVKNQHFADNGGTLCVLERDRIADFGTFSAFTDNFIVTEYSDEKVVFECHRYYFDHLSSQNQSKDNLYEMAVYNTKFSHKDVYTFCLANTADGWRVDDFYVQSLYRANVSTPMDHLGQRYPETSLLDPTVNPVEVTPVYNQQIEAEQLTHCLAESIKTIDPAANSIVFDHHSLILQLATVNDKYFAYNSFAPVAENGDRMFSASACEELLATVLGVNVNCEDLFNEHNYIVRDDMYVNPTFVERLTEYSCENLNFAVAGSGLDCSVEFDLLEYNKTYGDYANKGRFVFKYKLVLANNHWQFAGFERL